MISLLKRKNRRTPPAPEPQVPTVDESGVLPGLEPSESITLENDDPLIPSSELPSAAAQMAEIFANDDTIPTRSDAPTQAAALEQIPGSSDEAILCRSVEVTVLPADPLVALPRSNLTVEPESDAATPVPPEVSGDQSDEAPVQAVQPHQDLQSSSDARKIPFLTEPPAVPLPPEAAAAPVTGTSDWAFEEKLASHVEWLESRGVSGKRADLKAADLEGAELISANLRLADLRDANLKAADLLLADLRDTTLVRANLQDSCLVGANLEGANLELASLESAMGLVPHQLAGTNLREASLPKAILKFDALPEFERLAQMASKFFVATISFSLLSWLIIWRTSDVQLVANLSAFGFPHSSPASAALPADQFYLIASVALFLVYIVFHFHLQRLWDATLQLPAVFPDGHSLGDHAPRFVIGLLRAHFRWMNQDGPSTLLLEKVIAMFLAYWLVPLTLFFYWGRYLTAQDIHGTILQDLLVTVAAGMAFYATVRVGRSSETWVVQKKHIRTRLERVREANPAAVVIGFGLFLTFLSVGTIVGVPHDKVHAPQYMSGSIRRWASSILWSVGFEPYANLTESALSVPPANWSGTDNKLDLIQGANLNSTNFRYAEAYGIFLANSHLFQSDFQGAFLSAADFRGADMGQSNLRYAVLDEARMTHTNLDRATLDGANLGRADLREANLSYASLANTFLKDGLLTGATLYGANLTSSTMVRANLEKADLREATLMNANLDHADLQQAYFWSAKLAGAHLDNAQLGGAIFIDADLRNADLRGAQISGTVLSQADLTGADLDGLDLRSASGLTANQICSAKSRRWLSLSDALRVEVTLQCGAAHGS